MNRKFRRTRFIWNWAGLEWIKKYSGFAAERIWHNDTLHWSWDCER